MELFITIFATYLITIMLVETEGPLGIFYRLRNIKPIKSYGVLNCVLCTSVHVAALTALYLTTNPLDYVMTVLAIAGAVTAVDKVVEEVL